MTQDRAVEEGESRFQWEKELSLRSAQPEHMLSPRGQEGPLEMARRQVWTQQGR